MSCMKCYNYSIEEEYCLYLEKYLFKKYKCKFYKNSKRSNLKFGLYKYINVNNVGYNIYKDCIGKRIFYYIEKMNEEDFSSGGKTHYNNPREAMRAIYFDSQKEKGK